MNTVIERKQILETKMDNYTTPIGVALGFAISIFRRFPNSITSWCYRILCAIFAAFIFAPFAINGMEWASEHYAFWGFANPNSNKAVEPFIYCLSILCAEPTITFLTRFFEIVLPKYINRKLNADNTEEN